VRQRNLSPAGSEGDGAAGHRALRVGRRATVDRRPALSWPRAKGDLDGIMTAAGGDGGEGVEARCAPMYAHGRQRRQRS